MPSSVLNEVMVKEAFFSNLFSAEEGSAVKCRMSSIQAYILHSTFSNCSTSCSTTSSSREAHVSGGACFLDIKEMDVSRCLFTECKGPSLGSVFYAAGTRGRMFNISCLSDSRCGTTTKDYHSIYAFETSSSFLTNVNSSYSISQSIYGVIHFGVAPDTFNCSYSSFIFTNSENDHIPFGAGLINSNNEAWISHISFVNSRSSNGILTLWKGTYYFSEIIFSMCSGQLINRQLEDIISAHFIHCVFRGVRKCFLSDLRQSEIYII